MTTNQTHIIRFDGNYFSYTDNNGKLVKIPAISGKTDSQNSQLQNIVNKGPLPEGFYDVKQSQYQSLDIFNGLLGIAKMGEWKGSYPAWGTERVWLEPQATTQMYGRDDFTIHGGITPESAGCIDLVGNASTFFKFFKSLGSDAVLQVDYGPSGYDGSSNPLTNGNSNITIENIYSNQGKDLNEIKPLQNFLSASKAALEKDLGMSISEESLVKKLNNYKIKSGNSISKLKNSQMIKSDESVKDNIESGIITFITENNEEFSLVKDVWIPLKDGTIATIDSVINGIDYSAQALQNFINKELSRFTNSYKSYLDKNKFQIMGDLIAKLILGESLEEAMIKVAEVWSVNALLENEISKQAIQNLVKYLGVSDNVANGASAGIIFFMSSVLIAEIRGDGMNGKEYTETALKSAVVGAMQHFLPITPVGAVVAAVDGMVTAYEERGDLDSQGWQDLGTNTAAAVCAAYVGFKAGLAVGSFFGPAGLVIGAVVGAVVGAILYVPLKNLIEAEFNASEDLYDSIEHVFIKLNWSNPEKDLKQALKATEDILKSFYIDFQLDISIAIYNLFDEYGKKLETGEFWNPYQSLKIEAKEDGTGNRIIGIDPEGVVAIAREYYHDDIYGTKGSDNLVGKSGTNTIAGFDGNDHIEGRGDIDLLVGGKGDDEIFGGNGDDKIYGSEGSDNLFGGNGNDIIIGGSGSDKDQSSLEDGNDYLIGGGKGDDTLNIEFRGYC